MLNFNLIRNQIDKVIIGVKQELPQRQFHVPWTWLNISRISPSLRPMMRADGRLARQFHGNPVYYTVQVSAYRLVYKKHMCASCASCLYDARESDFFHMKAISFDVVFEPVICHECHKSIKPFYKEPNYHVAYR
jgi:hypothetical protein